MVCILETSLIYSPRQQWSLEFVVKALRSDEKAQRVIKIFVGDVGR